MFHSQLVEHATPLNDALEMPNASIIWGHGLPSMAMLEGMKYPTGGDDGLFQRLPVHDLHRALRLSAAGADPLDKVCSARFARRGCGACGDSLVDCRPRDDRRAAASNSGSSAGLSTMSHVSDERSDGGERRRCLVLVVADAVDRPLEHRLLAVRRVAAIKMVLSWSSTMTDR